jgi:hypothetical protein
MIHSSIQFLRNKRGDIVGIGIHPEAGIVPQFFRQLV